MSHIQFSAAQCSALRSIYRTISRCTRCVGLGLRTVGLFPLVHLVKWIGVGKDRMAMIRVFWERQMNLEWKQRTTLNLCSRTDNIIILISFVNLLLLPLLFRHIDQWQQYSSLDIAVDLLWFELHPNNISLFCVICHLYLEKPKRRVLYLTNKTTIFLFSVHGYWSTCLVFTHHTNG